jgi:predicted dehydrogenase
MQQLNLAFIGSAADAQQYGSISNRIHGARWVAFAPLEKTQSSLGRVLGGARASASLADLLSDPQNNVDALVIHAPPDVLPDLVKTAAQSDKPMLVGPLLANTSGALRAISEASNQGSLMPATPWRFIPAIQAVKASIDTGKLGEIGLIRIHRWNARATEGSYGIPSRIIPDIDIATWFFGSQPHKLVAQKSPLADQYIQIHLHFENGGMVVIDETSALPNGGDYFSLTVIGGTGAAYADDHRNMNLIVDGVYPHAIRTGQGAVHLAQQLQKFIDTCGGTLQPAVTTQDLLKVLQVSDAVIEAAATQRVSVWQEGNYVCG